MKRLAAIVLAAAFAAGLSVAALGQRGGLQRPLMLHGLVSTSPLLGLRYGNRQPWLVRLDPKTLKAQGRRRLALHEFWRSWSFSPDRGRLAFGNAGNELYSPARVRVVDARRLRTTRSLSLGLTGEVVYTFWPVADRLLALVRSAEDAGEDQPPLLTDRISVIDPTTGAVRSTEALEGNVIALARDRNSLVLLLAGRNYGPVRLAVADAEGRLASVMLEEIQAGWHETAGGVPREDAAAVAVDVAADRAYAVAARAPVAEVDLTTLTVGYHVPSRPVSLVGRLHDWLEPRAQAKGPMEGSWRSAVWLGDGRLAVYGREMSSYQAGDGLATRERPSGLVVIDTRDWTAHEVDSQASSLLVADGALLSWGFTWDAGTQHETGAGLNVYDDHAARRFHLFGARVVYDVETVGARAFVRPKNLWGRYAIVDLRTGRQLRVLPGGGLPLLLSTAGPSFYG